MSDSNDTPAEASAGPEQPAARKRGGGLNSLLLADLKAMAGGLGIPGAGTMKKAQLVDAIKAAQSGGQSGAQAGAQSATPPASAPAGVQAAAEKPRVVTRTRGRAAARTTEPAASADAPTEAPRVEAPRVEAPRVETLAVAPQEEQRAETDAPRRTRGRRGDGGDQPDEARQEAPAEQRTDAPDRGAAPEQQPRRERRAREDRGQSGQDGQNGQTGQAGQAGSKDPNRDGGNRRDGGKDGNREVAGKDARGERSRQQQDKQDRNQQQDRQQDKQDRQQQDRQQQDRQQDKQDRQQQGQSDQHDDDEEGRGRNRRRRGRERNRPVGGRNEPDTTVLEDDVLVPAAGILDVLDNYAFVRTTGYLPGPDDVYLSLSMVRKFGLRRGDAVVGQVRQPREGERKEKFNPMVRLESVNGSDPEAARDRVEFSRLTPVHPSERLRLETGSDNLIGRIIDLAAPLGKGQRGLVVSPAKAGKTTLLQAVAASITANNPECHLMVVLVDERPEEVTDFERSVKGEVIASTFDRPPADHTVVAELAIERAKRLVELGHDVVVLLDGLTRLARAYNLATPASGRMLSGGVDAAAMYPPKRFFGAARNIENGGSLTILATAVVDSGSAMDEVIFEEFTGTGNMELHLSRELADKHLFPAIDVAASGTRHQELLFSPEESAVVARLRGELGERGEQEAAELLHERLGSTQSNVELLMKLQRSSS